MITDSISSRHQKAQSSSISAKNCWNGSQTKLSGVIAMPQNGFCLLVLPGCTPLDFSGSSTIVPHLSLSLSLHSSQSRTRSLNPPSLALAHFPSPPTSSPSALPALSHVLSLLLPL